MNYQDDYYFRRESNQHRLSSVIGWTMAFTMLFNFIELRCGSGKFSNLQVVEKSKYSAMVDSSLRNVDYSVKPERRDVNEDGIGDVVLRKVDGKGLVLYGRNDGNYYFAPAVKGEKNEKTK